MIKKRVDLEETFFFRKTQGLKLKKENMKTMIFFYAMIQDRGRSQCYEES